MNKLKNKIFVKLFPVKPPLYADKYLKNRIWHIYHSKKIHLTFDDGPTPEVTIKVLDILDNFNVKATFFCIGRNVEKYPDIYKEIIKRGHVIGNHTYSHLNGWKTKNKEYISDIELASKNIKTNLFRPPYGKINSKQLETISKNYKIIMWDILSGDYSPKIDEKTCYNNVVKNVKEGSIIVFHDSIKASNNLFYTLPRIIDYFLEKSFKFGTL